MRRRQRTAAFPLHRHSLPQMAIDGILVAAAYFLAYRLRFDQGLPERYDDLLKATVGWTVAISLVVFAAFRLYHRWWRYTRQADLVSIAQAVTVATLAVAGFVALFKPVTASSRQAGDVAVSLPTGVIAMFFLLALMFVGGARFIAHAVYERQPLASFRGTRGERGVLIVGAGDGGQLVLREILRNPELGLLPLGFVDDDPLKQGQRIQGVKVLGTTGADFAEVLEEVGPQEVMIAVPSAPGTLRARIVRECRLKGIQVRTLPTVFELLQTGGNVVRQVREVQVEDVLGREPVVMDVEKFGRYLNGERVMVTGAGGSIGSELCRQIARITPQALILLDHAEDNLFTIQRELIEERHVHQDGLATVLADCKDGERMREVFKRYRPTVVFHAAAYKHVGLMELNPVEAVSNNSIATRLLARLAGELGVNRFVLVSTDKAVSPATVMGASKALAEYAIEAAADRWPQTQYSAVRFGNVLGSSGSVVPIFRRQIARGGPVTVTDPRMKRYFMTIPEAVQLILRSGNLKGTGTGGRASGSEIYVLDMGEPVEIMQLARDMIELSGLRPEKDIAIEVIGRRPGEKLDEELFNPFELVQPTPVERISRAERLPMDSQQVEAMFNEIQLLVLEGDAAALAVKVAELSAVNRAAAAE
ncbi:UDP-N-acetyl-alpha-D-glucosamine C6 dehydratase [Paraconexibacter sp. AEG42_29]|uniref:UDP-N-acetyl-alpha-D-glucosamine C6 dehydratase n=1 Tax=Paraconexibacter sp. AEG42_29 TaxID=2997339 RepID=A0AAU7ANZ0_9ACTN